MCTLAIGLNTTRAQVTDEELKAAESGQLKLLAPEDVPPFGFGEFYSWQHPWQPPLPFNVYPGLDVYDLGGGRFLSDDRLIDTGLLDTISGPMAATGTGVDNPMSA